MLRAVRTRALIPALGLALGVALACDRGAPAPAPAAPAAAELEVPSAARPEPKPAREREERPLPAFSGTSFDGRRISVSELLGRRLVLFFFDPSKPEAEPAARAVAAIAPLQAKHNFQILGVATGADSPQARAFSERQHLDFTQIDDASGSIARGLGLQVTAALIFVDSEGFIVGAMNGVLEGQEEAAAMLEVSLREQLRLPVEGAGLLEPGLGEHPKAPDFSAGRLDGGEPFRLAELSGRPLVLVFFLYTCPHCHDALRFFRSQLDGMPEAKRPALVGVSVSGRPAAVRDELARLGLDFFPVLLDPDGDLARRYAVVGGVPDILFIDGEGRIRARNRGWRDERDPPLLRMRLAQLAGEPVPLLLHQTGYSGNEFCAVCHEPEYETWRFTAHARAFDTLVRHAAERDEQCVSCHVVGFGRDGGYGLAAPEPWREDVGCESCHGRGGPHLEPGFVSGGDYQGACLGCHDATHSLGFEYAAFLPRVSHAANAHLLELAPDEKRTRLASLGPSRQALFPDARYVGSQACQGCHAAEYATWEAGPHARALASLEAEGKARKADCQRCHTTAYGRPGGFPEDADPAAHADLARVGCEACHGPAGDHVAETARKTGTVVSLADKCDSCVILQICGACHDDANDPGFEFEVKEKIEAQRHGTIEPGGKPKAGSQARVPALLEEAAAVQRAFDAGAR